MDSKPALLTVLASIGVISLVAFLAIDLTGRMEKEEQQKAEEVERKLPVVPPEPPAPPEPEPEKEAPKPAPGEAEAKAPDVVVTSGGAINARRLKIKTPCAQTGVCSDCDSKERICNITTILHKAPEKANMTVVLVDESLGY